MRIGGIILAALVLAGCSTAPAAAPRAGTTPNSTTTTTTSSTPAAPDPALIESRLVKAQLPDDVLTPFGFTRLESAEQKNSRIMECLAEFPTDGAMSMTRLSKSWLNKPAFSYVDQFSVSYRRVSAAAETVRHAREALECQPFKFGGEGPFTPEREVTLAPLGVDAQFAACHTSDVMRVCELVMSKNDLLTKFSFYGPQEADAVGTLEKAARATAPLLAG
ncbi:hypothetical protein [Saccharothrix syringae]|uniref:Sensor domain-containing protein n=1 Tax=Saccharothrix syringae TaxID=103733 RepID=A0A5Q0GXU9_SACSY|nr:hypothetical protein [Saccharothrix syringae]QFZ18907.1 hypothetical protein EKG83_16915 [Saccharothrix syringae]